MGSFGYETVGPGRLYTFNRDGAVVFYGNNTRKGIVTEPGMRLHPKLGVVDPFLTDDVALCIQLLDLLTLTLCVMGLALDLPPDVTGGVDVAVNDVVPLEHTVGVVMTVYGHYNGPLFHSVNAGEKVIYRNPVGGAAAYFSVKGGVA